MTKLRLITAFLVATMASANANVIDTTTGGAAGAYIAFGPGATSTFGQTFFADGTVLDSFSLYLETKTAGSGPLNLRGYFGTWTGVNVGTILYESTTQTMNAAGTQQQFIFTPNITVINGGNYVAFLSIANLPFQPTGSDFKMPQAVDDIAGSFVFLTDTTTIGWTTAGWSGGGGQDVFFKAIFDAAPPIDVPEPGTLFVFSGSLLGAAIHRRKKKPIRLSNG